MLGASDLARAGETVEADVRGQVTIERLEKMRARPDTDHGRFRGRLRQGTYIR